MLQLTLADNFMQIRKSAPEVQLRLMNGFKRLKDLLYANWFQKIFKLFVKQ